MSHQRQPKITNHTLVNFYLHVFRCNFILYLDLQWANIFQECIKSTVTNITYNYIINYL